MKKDKTKSVTVPLVIDEQPVKSPKVKLESLPDAIIDSQPRFSVGDKLIMRRDHLNDKKLYVCIVEKIDEKGDVSIRNLTLQQGFIFNLKNPPTLKLYITA